MNPRPFRRFGAALCAAVLLCACGSPQEPPSGTGQPVPVDLSPLAVRAGYAIYDISAGGCDLVEGSGLEDPVPIASVFKLWVLDAVARAVDSGDITWETVVPVRDELRSDPSGEVFSLPDGQEVTVRRLAELMIAISDNTATDHLLDLLGRERVEAVIGEIAPDGAARTLPLLSTADMARLKYIDPRLGEEFSSLDDDQQRALLPDLAHRVPFPWLETPGALDQLDLSTPRLVDDVEWFAGGEDICRTFADLAALAERPGLEPVGDILSANPGLPPEQRSVWESVWFKGGSEPGVLVLAYRLTAGTRDRVVFVALSDPRSPLVSHPDGDRKLSELLRRAGE